MIKVPIDKAQEVVNYLASHPIHGKTFLEMSALIEILTKAEPYDSSNTSESDTGHTDGRDDHSATEDGGT